MTDHVEKLIDALVAEGESTAVPTGVLYHYYYDKPKAPPKKVTEGSGLPNIKRIGWTRPFRKVLPKMVDNLGGSFEQKEREIRPDVFEYRVKFWDAAEAKEFMRQVERQFGPLQRPTDDVYIDRDLVVTVVLGE